MGARLWQPGPVPSWDDETHRGRSVDTLPRRPVYRQTADRQRDNDPGAAATRRTRAPIAVAVRGFVRRYGWRAYALPALVAVTVVALMTARDRPEAARPAGAPQRPVAPSAAPQPPAPPTASGQIALQPDAPGPNSRNTVLAADALPAGGPYSQQGSGSFRVLPGGGPVVGSGTPHRYSVDVENGITGIDLTRFAATVQATLSDVRSWAGHARVALQRVDSGPIAFHVTLVSSLTVRSLCGYQLPIETSCFVPAGSVPGGSVNRVVINDSRWVRGDASYIGDVDAYRVYMINHESGHALGHEHAHECLADGLAPVMMQQTIGLRPAGSVVLCQANPWPYPLGATDAPGAEQPDTPQNSEFGLKND